MVTSHETLFILVDLFDLKTTEKSFFFWGGGGEDWPEESFPARR